MYKDSELATLFNQDSCQTQKEHERRLGVTQQAISYRLMINTQFFIKNGENLFVILMYSYKVGRKSPQQGKNQED